MVVGFSLLTRFLIHKPCSLLLNSKSEQQSATMQAGLIMYCLVRGIPKDAYLMFSSWRL